MFRFMKIYSPVLFALLLMFVGAFGTPGKLEADDWLQWRNENYTSVSDETHLPNKMDPDSNLLWRVELPGTAGSSPIVVGDKIFCTSIDGNQLKLLCVVDGKIAWSKKLNGANQNSRDGANSASPSPSSDGKHIWAMMGNGALACFTIDGDEVWQKDLQKEYGKFDIQFGMSSTPLLFEGKLYLQLMHGNMRSNDTSKGQVICLDAQTGQQVWMQLRETDGVRENKHSYASPTLFFGKPKLMITHGADYVMGHSLSDGQEVWRCGGLNPKGPGYNNFLRFVSSPVCTDKLVIAPTAKRGPVIAVHADSSGDITSNTDALHWKLDKGTPDVATPVVYQDVVYLAGEKGDLTCLDLKTGNVVFRERMFADKHRSTPVAGDGKIYVADRRGNLFVLKAGSEPTVLSKTALQEQVTASPAISNGKIYVRSFDALYCFGDNQ